MLERLITPLKAAPDTLAHQRDVLRQRVRSIRGDGQERIWSLRTDALTRAEGLLEKVDNLPVVNRVATPVEKAVGRRLEALTVPDIEDYDALNARNASLAVRGLDRLELIKVRRYEAANKDRKTVLKAVNKELGKLYAVPEPVAQ